jgi:hypothetical protein
VAKGHAAQADVGCSGRQRICLLPNFDWSVPPAVPASLSQAQPDAPASPPGHRPAHLCQLHHHEVITFLALWMYSGIDANWNRARIFSEHS